MRLLLLFTGLLLATVSLAQSPYRLFRPNVQYLYTHQLPVSEYTSPLLGIKVGEEECTVLYESLQPNVLANDLECLLRVPAFIGSEVCQTATITTLNLGSDEAPQLLTLFPQRPVGSFWLATILNQDSIYARVEAVGSTEVLGLPDSVKAINFYRAEDGALTPLYDTPALRISRNYGLVSSEFLHWLGTATGGIELAGLSDPGVGVQNPSRNQVFQLIADDEIHVTTVNTFFAEDAFYHEYREKKNVYVNDGFLPNGDRYFAFRGDQKIYQEGPAANPDTLWLADQADTVVVPWPNLTFLDEQPGALLSSSDYADSWQMISLGHNYFCEQPAKRLGAPVLMSNEECAVILFDLLPGDDYYAHYSGPYYRNVGLAGFRFRLLEYADVDGNPTCGTPFDFVVNTQSPMDVAPLQLWPNPAQHQLQLSLPESWPNNISVRILNSYGQAVYEAATVRNDRPLDLSAFPPGNYYLHCFTHAGQYAIGKFIKY